MIKTSRGVPPALSPKAEEIIRHTTELLALGGYNSFSYADIAQVVGISKPSIHHHFPSKAELVRSAVARYRAEASRGMLALSEHVEDPFARLEGYCRYWAECIKAAKSPICICALLAAELPSIPKEVAEEVQGHFADLASWLQSVIQEGAIRGSIGVSADAESDSRAFMATVHGAMLAARAFGEPTMFWNVAGVALERLRSPGVEKTEPEIL